MKNFNYLILLVAFAVIVSCKKKEFPESSSENLPIFNCSMLVNGVAQSYTAGINNYYNYTSFFQDSNNVYGFIGNLKQSNCVSCPNSIQIQINDYKISGSNTSVNIDSALYIGNYPYLYTSNTKSYTVQFQSFYNKTASSYLWNFGDGSTSSQPNPIHTFSQGKYNTCLTVNGTNACVSTICSYQKLNFSSSYCTASILDSNLSANIKLFKSSTFGVAPFDYLWNFGDGGTSTLSNPTHTYLIQGSYPVTLRVIDANSDTAIANYNTITQNDISSCAANYKVSSINLSSASIGLSSIVVTWVDSVGDTYRSNTISQPVTSKFEIVSVEDYERNENNELTKKMHVKFSCVLYNGSNSIAIQNADAIICVAYK